MKPARTPASSRPKPYASVKNAPIILSVRRSLLALVERKQRWSEVSFPLKNLLVRAFDFRAQRFCSPLARQRSSCPWSSPILAFHHLIERVTVRLRVLRRPTRLSATLPPASLVPPPLEGHQIWSLELGRVAPGEHHPQPTIPQPRLNRPAETRR